MFAAGVAASGLSGGGDAGATTKARSAMADCDLPDAL